MAGRGWWIATGLLGAAAVVLGAFGTHGLEEVLLRDDLASGDAAVRSAAQRQVHAFETAVRYHFYHALALGLVAALHERRKSPWLAAAGWLFVAGIGLFSGTLYYWVLARPGLRALMAVVPIGGMLFILGWLAVAVGAAAGAARERQQVG